LSEGAPIPEDGCLLSDGAPTPDIDYYYYYYYYYGNEDYCGLVTGLVLVMGFYIVDGASALIGTLFPPPILTG
jgi:hypothetical protein